jgi:uncharacterized membrane-anchored protein
LFRHDNSAPHPNESRTSSRRWLGGTSPWSARNVNLAQEKDVTRLLAGMERTARNQLHLQHTIERLSVAAISYYVLSLVAAADKTLHVLNSPIEPELAEGLMIGPVVLGVVTITRRTRNRLMERNEG